MLKNHQKTIFYLNKAVTLSISPSTGAYYNEMADSYENQKLYKKAEGSYLKALLYDETPLTYYYLATMFDGKLNNKKSAVKYYKKYIAAQADEKQKTYREYAVARIATLSVH
jgi:tetratricopeptide (TPR) repeat protein